MFLNFKSFTFFVFGVLVLYLGWPFDDGYFRTLLDALFENISLPFSSLTIGKLFFVFSAYLICKYFFIYSIKLFRLIFIENYLEKRCEQEVNELNKQIASMSEVQK